MAFLRYTLETPARSTTTLVLVPRRYTFPVPEEETKAFPMVPFTSTLPVLQAVNAGLRCKAVRQYASIELAQRGTSSHLQS